MMKQLTIKNKDTMILLNKAKGLILQRNPRIKKLTEERALVELLQNYLRVKK